MIGGLDIRVVIDGKSFIVETKNDLRRLKQFLDETLEWLSLAPSLAPAFAVAEDKAQEVKQLLANEAIETSVKEVSLERTFHTIDYILIALQYMENKGLIPPDGVPVSQVYEQAISLGWTSRAREVKNATRVLEIMSRQNGDLVSVNRSRLKLTEEGRDRAISIINAIPSIDKRKGVQHTFDEQDIFDPVESTSTEQDKELTPTADNDEG